MSCPDCFSGSVHAGHPTGIIDTIHGLPVYIAKPPEEVTPKGIIVFISDAFGWNFPNSRLLSDRYAEAGFLVYLPDFMNGRSLPTAFVDMMTEKIQKPASWFTTIFFKPVYILRALSIIIPWLIKNRTSVCKPRIFNFFRDLRISPPPYPTNNLKIGAAGFCWGGRYTILLAHNSPSSRVERKCNNIELGNASSSSTSTVESLIDCAFTAHPSFLAMPTDINEVTLPLSVAIGDDDSQLKAPLILQMKDILERKESSDHEVVIMPGAKHGFAVRLDPTDKLQLEFAVRAEEQAISWFSKWFSEVHA